MSSRAAAAADSLASTADPTAWAAAAVVGAAPAGFEPASEDSLGGPTRVTYARPPVEPSPEGLTPHPPGMNWQLLTATLLLCGLGITMSFSASYFEAVHKHQDELYFLTRHLRYAAIAGAALVAGMQIPYQLWRRLAPAAFALAFALLIAVLVFGEVRNNARRWLIIGGQSFQPAEFAKVAFVLYMARSLVSKAERGALQTVSSGLLPHVAIFVVCVGLLMAQPDMGTCMVLGVLLFGMAFVAGARVAPLLGAGLLAVFAAAAFIAQNPMRLGRFKAWFDPFEDFHGKGYQLANSLLAVAMGGPFGRGLGASQQKLGYLPEAHTDFVLAIIGEELGVVGISVVALLFIWLLVAGMTNVRGARDEFGRMLAFGILLLIGTQAAVNFGVVLQLLPTKGLTLPFVSFGGTSLILMAFSIGVLLNVGRGGAPRFAEARPARDRRPFDVSAWSPGNLIRRYQSPGNTRQLRPWRSP